MTPKERLAKIKKRILEAKVSPSEASAIKTIIGASVGSSPSLLFPDRVRLGVELFLRGDRDMANGVLAAACADLIREEGLMREVIITCDRCGERCQEEVLVSVQALKRNEQILHSPKHQKLDGDYWPFEICNTCTAELLRWANEKSAK